MAASSNAEFIRNSVSRSVAVVPDGKVFYSLCAVALAAVFFASCRSETRLPDADSPEYREVVLNFYGAAARIQTGSEAGAFERLEAASQVAPAEPAIWYNMALLALRRGELEQAASHAATARRVAPNNDDVLLLSGLIELQRADSAQAVNHLMDAVRADTTNIRAMYVLAEMARTRSTELATPDAADPALLFERILRLDPTNTAAILQRLELAVNARKWQMADSLSDRLRRITAEWPEDTRRQIRVLEEHIQDRNVDAGITTIIRVGNLMKAVDAHRASLAALQTDILDPSLVMTRFVRLPSPTGRPSPADTALVYEEKPLLPQDTRWDWLGTVFQSAEGPLAAVAVNYSTIRIDPDIRLVFPGRKAAAVPRRPVAFLDYDYDFRMDLAAAGARGFRLYRQESDGSYTDKTGTLGLSERITSTAYTGIWPLDIDLEGDVDLVGSTEWGSILLLRNDGDGTFTPQPIFSETRDLVDLQWADVDDDGDPDATLLDADGGLHVYTNERSGAFSHRPLNLPGRVVAIHISDFDSDGRFELIVLTSDGQVASTSFHSDGSGKPAPIAAFGRPVRPSDYARVSTADLDNNGGQDLIVTTSAGSHVWLRDESRELLPFGTFDGLSIYDEADLDATGNLGLVALDAASKARHLVGRPGRDYLSRSILPKAADAVGDRRINSFGIGGEIELRTDLLYQKRLISSPLVHFGLGDRQLVDVARIVWPNGTSQAEFDLTSDQALIATQSLKGSCPWVFTFDGSSMRFVTDFLWRSPLGLRINAVETAGIATTEDWVKIDGDALVRREGIYDVRITAELWETHFFDHVALRAVDHPVGTEIFVDEVFVFPPNELTVHTTSAPQPVRVWDHTGRDVTDIVAAVDGRYVDSFELYSHQGLTRNHHVEIELIGSPSAVPLWLIASGWIRPTDSSINVALGQGDHPRPQGVRLEALRDDGTWVTVRKDLGFPAGKSKTMLIDMTDVLEGNPSRRVRLVTNLEIYWDEIAWAEKAGAGLSVVTDVPMVAADLRYRGFSLVEAATRSTPETPAYDSLAATTQQWRDLVGFHTRFGDVAELVASVDDRYVIMNAGDEMVLAFEALPPVKDGWKRDFILVGDGWVKDGDYNTTFSRTVLPLPDHAESEYETPLLRLPENAAYNKHPDDWTQYHTRYVTPANYVATLRPLP